MELELCTKWRCDKTDCPRHQNHISECHKGDEVLLKNFRRYKECPLNKRGGKKCIF